MVPVRDDPSTIYTIQTWRLQEVTDPFCDHVWSSEWTLSRDNVSRAIADGRTNATPWSDLAENDHDDMDDKRRYHVERVAYLVMNRTDDPISIEVIDVDGSTRIHDGHHRLAAAIFRGDPEIRVDYGGFVDAFARRFREARASPWDPELVFAV